MPDQRSVMKEFRFLDEKRVARGLTPAEEARYAHLRDLIGPELGAGGLRPGFDVDAAAAQLRDSLLPAGLRNRPPPTPAPPEPPAAEEPTASDAIAAAYEDQPFPPLEAAPQPDGSLEPAPLSEAPPAWDAGAAGEEQAWDPNAAPPAEGQPELGTYDAAAWDTNAQPDAQAAWDPNAPPQDAAQAAWDPNAPPQDAAQAGWDAGAQPWDAGQAAWDPNAPPDGAAQPDDAQAAWDATGAYDAEPVFDPNAPPFEPGASPEAGAQAYPEPPPETAADLLPEGAEAPAPDLVADDGSLAPAGWYAEPPPGEAAPGAAPEGEPTADDAGVEAVLPFDPAAAAAISPGELPEGFGERIGEYDDTAAFDARLVDAAPADLPQEGAEFQAAQVITGEESEGWQPEQMLEEGFELESGGSFDAAAEAAAPEWAGGAPAPPWDSAAAPAPGEPEGFAVPDAGAAAAPGELEEFAVPEAEAELAAAPEAEAEYVEPLSPEEGAGPPELEAVSTEELAAAQPEAVEPLEEPRPEAALPADEFAVDVTEAVVDGAPMPALDFSRPDFSEGAPEDAAFAEASQAALAEPAAPEPSFDVSVDTGTEAPPPELAADAAPALDLGPAEVAEAPADVSDAVLEVSEDDIPTIEGEEILEEIPPEEVEPPQPLDLAGEPAAAEPSPAEPAPALELGEPASPEPEPEAAPAFAEAEPEPALAEPEEPAAVAEPEPEVAPLPAEAEPEAAMPEPEPAPPPPAPSAIRAPPVPPPPPARPPPVAAAPVAPPPVPAPSADREALRVHGAHRVVVHTVEGQVKRGVLEDAALDAGSLGLVPQPGAAPEILPADKVKAIFFMLGPGEKAPAPEGKKVRVTFRDGRQVAGFSPDYRDEGVGFFMIPGDTRTNTGRIWVYRSAVRQVSVT